MGSGMSTIIPYGATQILEHRKAGKRPADMVLVSLIGPLREVNPVIIATSSRAYDWRFLVDLSVLIVANSNTPTTVVRRVIDAIKALPARSLSFWFTDRQNGRHLIIEGVIARPGGAIQYMDAEDRRRYSGIGVNNKDMPRESNF